MAPEQVGWALPTKSADAVSPGHELVDSARPTLNAAQSAIDAGLKIARACGYSIFHIDLQLELVRLRLLQGNPSEALAALRTALDETRPKNAEAGEPELLAALDPCCGYAWPVPEALQLRAEALLLQAAQKLNISVLVTTSLIEQAEE